MRSTIQQTTGSIPDIMQNTLGAYEGNLVHYFQALFNHADNLNNPYHNLGHIGHVTFLCHEACLFYGEELSPRDARNLLIAAIFHDFNHTGTSGDDWRNIYFAIEALRKHILLKDEPFFESIAFMIRATKFPYETPSEELGLEAQILRDADKCQALSATWIQQVVIGLAKEWGKPRLEVLGMQPLFHQNLVFHTRWAKQEFPPHVVKGKVDEARRLLEVLNMDPALLD